MTNTVRLRGVIRDPFYLEEREDGGTCYVTYVSIMRNSGISDTPAGSDPCLNTGWRSLRLFRAGGFLHRRIPLQKPF